MIATFSHVFNKWATICPITIVKSVQFYVALPFLNLA